jgi:hairy-and-enhancer-of-split protein
MFDSGIDSETSPEANEFLASRTHQYRKVMKPLLERKRRARINQCLDELKDLMVGALETEGENVSKLEKADILELTVQHLRRLKQRNALGLTPEATYANRFRAGYSHCAKEVTAAVRDLSNDPMLASRLSAHLSRRLQVLESASPSLISQSPSASISWPFSTVFATPNTPISSAEATKLFLTPSTPKSSSSPPPAKRLCLAFDKENRSAASSRPPLQSADPTWRP